jgi:hypothetical protein
MQRHAFGNLCTAPRFSYAEFVSSKCRNPLRNTLNDHVFVRIHPKAPIIMGDSMPCARVMSPDSGMGQR